MLHLISKPSFDYENFHGIVTVAEEMKELFTLLKRVAQTDAAVLLRGETGTGKELVAHALHQLSERRPFPFQAVNCATLTPELLASELFGHVKGAFTGAIKDKKGLFAAADKGTLFLDEIGEMPLDIQARLLRVLQEKLITPLGSTAVQKVDVRIVSATHKALRDLVAKGLFREDLMYRIRVVPIFLPRLVDRKGDVEALTWYFIDEENRKGGRQIQTIEASAMESILRYPWPGNIRELRNNIQFAFAIGVGESLKLKELTPELQGKAPETIDAGSGHWENQEKKAILKAMEEAKGRKGKAAEILGMSRSTLWRKLREYHLV